MRGLWGKAVKGVEDDLKQSRRHTDTNMMRLSPWGRGSWVLDISTRGDFACASRYLRSCHPSQGDLCCHLPSCGDGSAAALVARLPCCSKSVSCILLASWPYPGRRSLMPAAYLEPRHLARTRRTVRCLIAEAFGHPEDLGQQVH